MNLFEVGCSKRIEVLIRLLQNRRLGLLKVRKYKSLYQTYTLCGNNGNTKQIIREFKDSGILKKDKDGYFVDVGKVQEIYKDSIYFDVITELGWSVI